MKNRTTSILGLLAITITTLSFAETKDFEQTLSSDPSTTILKMNGISCDIEVVGTDSNVIRIVVEDVKAVPKKAEGLRSLLSHGNDNTGLGLELQASDENASTLVLKQVRRNFGDKVLIEVPVAISIAVETHINTGFKATGISGEVAVKTLNGEIDLKQVTGPIVLNTINGRVSVEIIKLNQETPSSINSVNGQVEVWMPENDKASFKLSVLHGDVYTDLDIQSDTDSGKSGMNHFFGSRKVGGELNGGGVSFDISTINGEIYLRKAL